MSIVHPRSLEEAVQVIRKWRERSDDARISDDFDGWHFDAGKPIDKKINFVKLAILVGHPIPKDFKHWDQVFKKDLNHWQSLAHWAAEQKHSFPADFQGWDLLDSRGTPVIHTFMKHTERVPGGFAQWHIKDKAGMMAAHVYPMLVHMPLPAAFDDWHLRDGEGQTVAHRLVHAAYFMSAPALMSFPDDPDIWCLRNGKKAQGDTVMHLAASFGMRLPDSLPLKLWDSLNPEGKTVIDLAREYGHAHLAAQYEAKLLRETVQVRDTSASIFSRDFT